MRLLIINTDYLKFIEHLYAKHPGLEQCDFAEQMKMRWNTLFGTANFYSTHLLELGHEAWDVIANLEPAQKQWAREHGVKCDEKGSWHIRLRRGFVPWIERSRSRWIYEILAAQIKCYRPDIIYSMAIETIDSSFLRSLKGYYRYAVGQHAAPIPTHDLREYDLMLSSLPNQVDYFRRQGLQSEMFKLGFEPKILRRLIPGDKIYDIVFVGGLSGHHSQGGKILEQLASVYQTAVWGYGVEKLARNSAIVRSFRGPLWGVEMYQALRDARIVFNRHISVADGYANNMRLYETTGVGTLLLTDHKQNLREMFEQGREVVAYRDANECAELANYYLKHESEREKIAAAGQQRTLREHTWHDRMKEMVDIIERYL